jgi:hypothetical protein
VIRLHDQIGTGHHRSVAERGRDDPEPQIRKSGLTPDPLVRVVESRQESGADLVDQVLIGAFAPDPYVVVVLEVA